MGRKTIIRETRLCKCGCGRSKDVLPNSTWQYFSGHNRCNVILSKESVEKRQKTRKENAEKRGYYRSDESINKGTQTRREIDEARGYHNPHEMIQKLRKPHSEEWKQNLRGDRITRETRTCICGCNETFTCKVNSTKRYIWGHNSNGETNPNWLDGASCLPYDNRFNQTLRDNVRKRDDYTCQCCGMTEEEHLIVYGMNLHAHHIDYNKLNSILVNLTALCLACNNRVNHNREYWKEFFTNKLQVKTGSDI